MYVELQLARKPYRTVALLNSTDSTLFIHEPRHEKMCLQESPTRQDTNWPAKLQRPARNLFRIYKLEVSFCLGSDQQRRWSDCADAQADLRLCCSHMALDTFSHGLAHILKTSVINACFKLCFLKSVCDTHLSTWHSFSNTSVTFVVYTKERH